MLDSTDADDNDTLSHLSKGFSVVAVFSPQRYQRHLLSMSGGSDFVLPALSQWLHEYGTLKAVTAPTPSPTQHNTTQHPSHKHLKQMKPR